MSDSSQIYLEQKRGDRAHPGFFHRRRQSLRLLCTRLEEIVMSPTIAPGRCVVDYGCADKPYEALFRLKFREYIGADLPGNRRAQITLGKDGALPVESESMDCVLSTQVLEHVANPQLYLQETYRVLKPGGSLILSTHGMYRYHPDPADYWRWTIEGLRLEISRAGFDIWRTYSILRICSWVLTMWQDAALMKSPRFCHPFFTGVTQTIIGWLERRQPEIPRYDAALFLIVARKSSLSCSITDPDARFLVLALEDIQSVIPPTAILVVVNEDQWDRGLLEPRSTFPFLERNGEYWGPPSNGRVALAELGRLRRLGAAYIVFSWNAFWWLNHYRQMQRYLRSKCDNLLANDRVRVFALPALGGKTQHSRCIQ